MGKVAYSSHYFPLRSLGPPPFPLPLATLLQICAVTYRMLGLCISLQRPSRSQHPAEAESLPKVAEIEIPPRLRSIIFHFLCDSVPTSSIFVRSTPTLERLKTLLAIVPLSGIHPPHQQRSGRHLHRPKRQPWSTITIVDRALASSYLWALRRDEV